MHPTIELNAAIEKMVAGEDHDATAAKTVIAYGSQLPSKGGTWWSTKFGKNFTWPRWFRGHAAGVGDVHLSDEKNGTTQEWGTKKERIGHYRLWKNQKGLICFHHYWASSLATAGEDDETTVFYLFYNPATFSPTGVAREHHMSTRSLDLSPLRLLFEFKKFGLTVIHGEIPSGFGSVEIRVLHYRY